MTEDHRVPLEFKETLGSHERPAADVVVDIDRDQVFVCCCMSNLRLLKFLLGMWKLPLRNLWLGFDNEKTPVR